jgi:hypothetical protein
MELPEGKTKSDFAKDLGTLINYLKHSIVGEQNSTTKGRITFEYRKFENRINNIDEEFKGLVKSTMSGGIRKYKKYKKSKKFRKSRKSRKYRANRIYAGRSSR